MEEIINIDNISFIFEKNQKIQRLEKLSLGWSDEDKYIVTLVDGKKFLLRVLKKENYISQLEALMILEKFSKLSENVPKVFGYGVFDDGKNAYVLLSYVEGSNAMQQIASYDLLTQYNFGFEMGKTIKSLHDLSKQKIMQDELQNYLDKVKIYIDYFLKNRCKFQFLGDKDLEVKNFLSCLQNRPFVMLHNDFHLGNMIVDGNNISLIDFNRACYGDMVKEFDGIAWSVRSSKEFAQGLLDAYLENQDEEEFFKLLKGYINIWQLQMLYFIDSQDEDEKREVMDLIKFVETWYDGDLIVPSWFEG